MNNIIKDSFFICATEQSGDNIGEKIIHSLQQNNNYIFDGVGGSKMAPLINKLFYKLEDFKSIGILEIVGSIGKYLSMIEKLSNVIVLNQYKIVITIDSPDFNFRIAKKIRKKGYKGKIIHVVAPTVWAWREGRAKNFAKVFDKLLTIFPFEAVYFEKYNLSTTFIGHPIYYVKNYSKNINKYIVFMLGSREGEVLSLIKYFKIASDYLDEISSKFIIFIPTLPHLKNKIINLTKNWKKKPIIQTNEKIIEDFYSQTCLALVCSGTASLEIAKRKIPQLIIYKLNYFTYIILKSFVNIRFANIINIMANKMIIPEVINTNLSKNNLLHSFKKLINDFENLNEKQINESKYYIEQLILKKSPVDIASKEIQKLFF